MPSTAWHRVYPIASGIDREARNTPDLLGLFYKEARRLARPNHNASGPQKDWTPEQVHEYLAGHLLFLAMMARRYRGRLEILDAIQEGYFGLLRAAENHDGERSRFLRYAWYWIRSKISRAERNLADPVRYPVHQIATARRLSSRRAALAHLIGHHPSLAELAKESGLSLDQIYRRIRLPYEGTVHPDQHLYAEADHQGIESGWSEMVDRSCLSPDLLIMAREEFHEMLSTVGQMLQRAKRHRHPALAAFIQYYGLDRGGVPRTLQQVGDMRPMSHEAVRQKLDSVWLALDPLFPQDQYQPWLLTLHERVADLEDALGEPVDFTAALQTMVAPYLVITPPGSRKKVPLVKMKGRLSRKSPTPTPEEMETTITVMEEHLHELPKTVQRVIRFLYGLKPSRARLQEGTVAKRVGVTKRTVLIYRQSALRHFRTVGMPAHVRHEDIIKHIRSQHVK